ncbi:Hypothetical predicted protein [Olea europaea subsp. europaea]|uniref:Uncharacterized protein n=1 Tax=Olea europaea subsp. europaea TaxID=158383 RepID=A0A8S0QT20_OLEEU|nr:Hypothetical predicted protein [Olea europaea subsp. europaea]
MTIYTETNGGVRVEQVEQCIPPVFRETLSIMVTIRYDGLTCNNEDLALVWSPLGILPARRLGLAWRNVGSLELLKIVCDYIRNRDG